MSFWFCDFTEIINSVFWWNRWWKGNSKLLWYDQAYNLPQEFATAWLECPTCPVHLCSCRTHVLKDDFLHIFCNCCASWHSHRSSWFACWQLAVKQTCQQLKSVIRDQERSCLWPCNMYLNNLWAERKAGILLIAFQAVLVSSISAFHCGCGWTECCLVKPSAICEELGGKLMEGEHRDETKPWELPEKLLELWVAFSFFLEILRKNLILYEDISTFLRNLLLVLLCMLDLIGLQKRTWAQQDFQE